MDWQGKVYHESDFTAVERANWDLIKARILKRDKYRCVACGARFPKKYLSAHHVIPRSEGGPSTDNNLVTICHSCHDIVEGLGYRTIAQIRGCTEPAPKKKRKPIPKASLFDDDGNIDWHAYVYGGYKRRD